MLFLHLGQLHTMEYTQDIYDKLQEKTEQITGCKMKSPRDFDYLSTRILDKTKQYLSPITLKRFWGYLGDKYQKTPYRNTLNILAQYAGYISIEAFVESLNNTTSQSDFLPNNSLQASSLKVGDKVQLMWHPDRCVTIEYQGMNMFKVAESINSKLSKGDTFILGNIIDGEPLHLHCLIHEGGLPTNYICGRVDGIKFKQL